MADNPLGLDGLTWHENGQCTLSGALLDAYRKLDAMFVRLAARCGAVEHRFPTFIAADVLGRLDYFRSFPHLATFPVTLDGDPANLQAFVDGTPLDAQGRLHLTRHAALRDVLTPAACYHCYPSLQGRALNEPTRMTTLATCFRREAHYLPLQRQWSFSMREIVCVGSADEVTAFIIDHRGKVEPLLQKLAIKAAFEHASDPFFNPRRNPKYIAQKLDPVKTEIVFGGNLAIGSLNLHRNYFGEAFGIRRDGQAAFSGCVAFGLERWLYALFSSHGPNVANWPNLDEAA